METFFSYPSARIAYGILTLVSWYGVLAFEYALNGGDYGRGRWWVFECFWEDVLMNIPGGSKRKAKIIKRMVGEKGDGCFCGGSRSWTNEELRKTGDYEACGRAMFGSPLSNWLGHALKFLVALCLGPAAICTLVAIVTLSAPFLPWKEFLGNKPTC